MPVFSQFTLPELRERRLAANIAKLPELRRRKDDRA
jgi:hypothetical protein